MQDISGYVFLCNFDKLTRKKTEYHFRCQICGDSKKSKTKKRGWIYWDKKTNCYIYHCFNCGVTMSFLNFLKQYHADAFKDYIRENFSDKQKERRLAESEQETTGQEQTAEPIFYATMDLPKLSDLPEDHDAVKYFKDRKIPTCYMKYFRYSENYKAWVNTKIPDKFSHINDDDRRIVIPFYTIDRKLFGCAGRALDNENVPKYITIRFKG